MEDCEESFAVFRYNYFGEEPMETLWKLMSVNMDSVVGMTRLVLPDMVRRRSGAIINISSSAAAYPTPLLSLYSATKSFVDTFSQAISWEYAEHGITVQSVRPFYVETPMTSNISSVLKGFLWKFYPDARTYVESALRTLGHVRATEGYFYHWLQRSLLTMFGPWPWGYSALKFNKRLLSILHKKRFD